MCLLRESGTRAGLIWPLKTFSSEVETAKDCNKESRHKKGHQNNDYFIGTYTKQHTWTRFVYYHTRWMDNRFLWDSTRPIMIAKVIMTGVHCPKSILFRCVMTQVYVCDSTACLRCKCFAPADTTHNLFHLFKGETKNSHCYLVML